MTMSDDEYLDLCTPKCSACHHPGHSKRSRKCPLHPDNRVTPARAAAPAPVAPAPTPAPVEDSPSPEPMAAWGVAAMSCEPVPCVVVDPAMVAELEEARLELVRRGEEIERLSNAIDAEGLTALRDRARAETAEAELARRHLELIAEAKRTGEWEALAIASDAERDAAIVQVADLCTQLSRGEEHLAEVAHERDVLRSNLMDRDATVSTLAARWDDAWMRARLWKRAARKLYGEVLAGEKSYLDLGAELFEANLELKNLRHADKLAKAMNVENGVQRAQLAEVEAQRRALDEEVATLRAQLTEQASAKVAVDAELAAHRAQLTEAEAQRVTLANLRAQFDEMMKAPPAPPPAPPTPKKRGEKGQARRTAIRRHRRVPVRTRFLLREVADELRLLKLQKDRKSRTIDEIERDRRRALGTAPLPPPPEDDDEVTDETPEDDDDDA